MTSSKTQLCASLKRMADPASSDKKSLHRSRRTKRRPRLVSSLRTVMLKTQPARVQSAAMMLTSITGQARAAALPRRPNPTQVKTLRHRSARPRCQKLLNRKTKVPDCFPVHCQLEVADRFKMDCPVESSGNSYACNTYTFILCPCSRSSRIPDHQKLDAALKLLPRYTNVISIPLTQYRYRQMCLSLNLYDFSNQIMPAFASTFAASESANSGLTSIPSRFTDPASSSSKTAFPV